MTKVIAAPRTPLERVQALGEEFTRLHPGTEYHVELTGSVFRLSVWEFANWAMHTKISLLEAERGPMGPAILEQMNQYWELHAPKPTERP